MTHFRKAALASAIAAAMASPLAWSGGDSGTSVSSTIDKEKSVTKEISLKKAIELTKRVGYEGDVSISGEFTVRSLGLALIDNEQFSTGNDVENDNAENDATIGGADAEEGDDSGAFRDASGNIGANVAAGTGNQQDNAASLAAADARWVFGDDDNGDDGNGNGESHEDGVHVDAEIFVDQVSADNSTTNSGASNGASVGGNAFQGASGNIGVNVAGGTGNQQKNNLAVAWMSGKPVLTEATVTTLQDSHGNWTGNLPDCECDPTTNNASIAGNAFQGASGNIGVNVAAGTGNQQSNSLAIAGAEM